MLLVVRLGIPVGIIVSTLFFSAKIHMCKSNDAETYYYISAVFATFFLKGWGYMLDIEAPI